MGAESVLFVTWIRSFEISHGFVANKKFQTSVKFRRHFPDDPKLMDLSNPWFLFQHEVGHVSPV